MSWPEETMAPEAGEFCAVYTFRLLLSRSHIDPVPEGGVRRRLSRAIATNAA